MARLSLKVLGAPEVWHGDRQLLFPTRKTVAILAYLAVEGGKHTRDKLVGLFWGGRDELHGRASLRRALSSIRRDLEKGEHPASSQHLVVEQDTVRVNMGPGADIDVRALETALEQLALLIDGAQEDSGAHGRKTFGKELGDLERIAASCRGEFLEGLSLPDAPEFDMWLGIQREVWHQRIGLLLERLTDLQALAGELGKAARTARAHVDHNPFDEEAYRTLLRLLLATGDRKSAQHAYTELRNMLAEEWATVPSQETEGLVSAIGDALTVTSRSGPSPALPLQPQALFERYMVGRASEFQDLVANFNAAKQGNPHMVAIVGEAGIGKTRLATEFLGWAATQGANVLMGRAFEMSGRFPYQPVTEAVRAGLDRHNSPDDLLDDVWLAELSRLMPELRERYPDLPAVRRQDTVVKSRLFEAVARLLQVLAARQPLVLFVDDVQWADVASLDLLQYIVRRWVETGTTALLLLNLRAEFVLPDLLFRTTAVGQWLTNLMREAPCKQLVLEALTEADTIRLVRSLSTLPDDPGPDNEDALSTIDAFGKQLFTETGGQPFFVIETLKALQERGLLTIKQRDGTEWNVELSSETSHYNLKGFVAPGVREMVRGRLTRLSPDVATLLTAAAVLGRDFNFDILCSVAGLPEDRAIAGLEKLLAGHLLAETRVSRSLSLEVGYLFAHDKVREIVYDEMGTLRRRVLHRRALDALMSHNIATAELAHHALAAGQTPLAFHLNLTSGDAALHLFAVQDAIAHYERARQLLREQRKVGEHAVQFSITDLKALYSQLGRAYELTNRWEQVRSNYEEMLSLARDLREPYLECAALNRLATLGVHGNPDIQPASLLEEALRVAQKSGDKAGMAETEWAFAQMCFVQREAQAAMDHAERARKLSHDLELGEIEARSLNVMAYACTDLNQWEQALGYGHQAQLIYRKQGNKAMEADSLCVAANSCIHLGRPQDALDLARGAQLMSEHIDNSWGQASSGLFITLALMEVDDCSAALQIAEKGLVLTRQEVHSAPMLIFVLARSGGARRGLGMVQEALEAHLEAFKLSAEPGLRWWFTEMVAAELCADYCAVGDWALAHHYAIKALSARNGALPYVSLLFPSLIEALVRSGYWENASAHVQLFGQHVGSNPRMRLSELRAEVLLSHARNETEKAHHALEQAVLLARRHGLLGEIRQMYLPRG